jgi:hypothetical protein
MRLSPSYRSSAPEVVVEIENALRDHRPPPPVLRVQEQGRPYGDKNDDDQRSGRHDYLAPFFPLTRRI